MENNDKIKELFSEKLGAYEAPVRPELWTSISAQIGVNVAATTGSGLSGLAKGIIGAASVGVISVAAYFIVSTDDSNTATEKNKSAVVLESSNEQKESPSVDQSTILSNEQPQANGERLNENTEAALEDRSVRPSELPAVQEESNTGEVPAYQPKEREEQPIWAKTVDTNRTNQNKTTGTEESAQAGMDETENAVQSGEEQRDSERETKKLASITLTPNSFTPNGDGINDEFFIRYEGELLDFHLVIMDTKNTVVHQSNDPDFVWKGTTQGHDPAPEGKYVYMITARDSAGNPVNAYNSLMLIRTP